MNIVLNVVVMDEKFIKTVFVLICVVFGVLILAGLCTLLDDTALIKLTEKIQKMFNYIH